MKLSPTMQKALDYMKEHGALHRYPGGFWCRSEAPHHEWRNSCFGTSTVNALESRGVAEYTEWQEGRNGKFPIVMKLRQGVGS